MRNKCKVCGANCQSGNLCYKHAPRKAIKKIPLKKSAPKAVSKEEKIKKIKEAAAKKAARGKTAHKQKKKSIKTLKNKLWMVFSKYIRLRDSDEDGYCKCFTSGERMWWRDAQAGHFQSRRFNSTFIHEKNSHAQSPYDNIFLAGNQYIYGKRLDEVYGEGTADELIALSRQTFKMTIPWLEEQYQHYSKEVERLLLTKKF